MAGALGYLRGLTRCFLCNREHERTSVSFGICGSVSICPGHPVSPNRTIPGASVGQVKNGGEDRHKAIGWSFGRRGLGR
jgi:hypothetical protein